MLREATIRVADKAAATELVWKNGWFVRPETDNHITIAAPDAQLKQLKALIASAELEPSAPDEETQDGTEEGTDELEE